MAEGSGSTCKPKRVAIQNPQWRVQALSVPSPDSDLSLYVAFDNVRYLFGVGEGTQRTFVQRKTGLKGIEAVFVLGADGEGRRVGGLGGQCSGAVYHLS
jgi:ribonuclease Z